MSVEGSASKYVPSYESRAATRLREVVASLKAQGQTAYVRYDACETVAREFGMTVTEVEDIYREYEVGK